MGVLKEKEAPDRYIFNAQQRFICNVFFCYAFYIVAICFPNVVWLGAFQVFCVLVQLITHALLINIAMKWPYNPRLASTVFLQLPVAGLNPLLMVYFANHSILMPLFVLIVRAALPYF